MYPLVSLEGFQKDEGDEEMAVLLSVHKVQKTLDWKETFENEREQRKR